MGILQASVVALLDARRSARDTDQADQDHERQGQNKEKAGRPVAPWLRLMGDTPCRHAAH
jgi:hypothetical protein